MGDSTGFMSKLIKKYRKLFLNGASLALVFILLGSIFYSLYRVSNFNNLHLKNQEIKTTIIARSVDSFNQEVWYGFYNFGIWSIQSKTRLEIGFEYKFNADLINFEKEEKFQLYNLSTGVVGKLKVTGEVLKNKICSLSCSLIQNVSFTKRNAQNLYLRNSCHEFYPVLKSISSKIDCSNVAGLSIGLVLGGTDYFSTELKTDFKKTGLMHIVAVSGFQIGLIMSLVEFFLRKSLVARNLRLLLFSVTLGFFIFLFGPEPPVIRSSLSFLIASSSLFIFGRRLNGLRSLVYSGVAMLLINPFYLFSISFQLSFIASFALIVSFEEDLFQFKHLNNFWNLMSSTIATFLYTLPILVSIGGGISMIAVFTNIVVIPIIPFITALNLAGFIPFVGSFFMMVALVIQTIFILFIEKLSTLLPVLNFEIFSLPEIILYYLFLTLAFLGLPKIFTIFLAPKIDHNQKV